MTGRTAKASATGETAYGLDDLAHWEERIYDKAAAFGLTTFRQELELCDHEQMLIYMAYDGMPAHFPHWSYGK